MYTSESEIMGNIGFGNDQYTPIENEPMGADYSKFNFDLSTPIDQISSGKIYNYNPLTYKTSDKTYMDSWDSINEYFASKKPRENMVNFVKKSFDDPDTQYFIIIITFLFIIIIIFAYINNKQSQNLQKIIEILMKNNINI